MFLKYLAGFLLLMASSWCHAGVVINTTRIIFNEADGEASAQLRNGGAAPLLVQTWLDAGDPRAKVESLHLPFAMTPSTARIDPARSQAVRIFRTRDELPKDRETLFWFNALEIPPMPTQRLTQGENLLQLSFRTRIKFFYRPAGLSPSFTDSLKLLQFNVTNGADGTLQVIVHNPSPYHITLRSLSLREGADAPALTELTGAGSHMVLPGGDLSLPMKWVGGTNAAQQAATAYYTIINDQGGESRLQKGHTSHEEQH